MGGLEKALQRLCTSAQHGSQIKRVSSVGNMLAVDGAGQKGCVLPTQLATWEAESRCSLTWSTGVPQEVALLWPGSWLRSIFLTSPSPSKPHSCARYQVNLILRCQVPLLMCALMGTVFSRDTLQIQMRWLERPFLEILLRQAGRMLPLLSVTNFCLQAWDCVAGCPYSRQALNVKNWDEKLHQAKTRVGGRCF